VNKNGRRMLFITTVLALAGAILFGSLITKGIKSQPGCEEGFEHRGPFIPGTNHMDMRPARAAKQPPSAGFGRRVNIYHAEA
jgi:hypothetical protein